MAVWKRRAIELFPELRQEVQEPHFTPYMLFFELLPMERLALEEDNNILLRRIFGFSEWCMAQKTEDLWNSAGVCFYEHIFDCGRHLWPVVVQWLSPTVVHQSWPLWEARLNLSDLEKIRELIERRTKHLYRDLEMGDAKES